MLHPQQSDITRGVRGSIFYYLISDLNDSYLEELGFSVTHEESSKSIARKQIARGLSCFRENNNMAASTPGKRISVVRQAQREEENSNSIRVSNDDYDP